MDNRKLIREGMTKKGGVNPPTNTPRPTPPPAARPQGSDTRPRTTPSPRRD